MITAIVTGRMPTYLGQSVHGRQVPSHSEVHQHQDYHHQPADDAPALISIFINYIYYFYIINKASTNNIAKYGELENTVSSVQQYLTVMEQGIRADGTK